MLQIQGLFKSYGDRLVLSDLNLAVQAGEVYGLLGPNGAGKTTIINIICNLVACDRGRVTIGGLPVSRTTQSWIGVAPQENLVYKSLTCQENLDFFGKIYGLTPKQRRYQIRACLEAVSLLEQRDYPAEKLSGGMQRRLNVAIALVHRPKLVILDEPTVGLDIETRYDLWRLIEQLQQQGTTVLLTTHLLDEAERLCQRIGMLKQGKIVAEGNLQQLRQWIPAAEIAILKTPQEQPAIQRAQSLGLTVRRYGKDLAIWLPEVLELGGIVDLFAGIPLEAIAKQPVQLEQIYLEVMQAQETRMSPGDRNAIGL